ncbi:MAG: hypothetical protein RI894_1247 [Bacteroidota bacterium]|jgi:hypothetical protein
MNFNEVLEIYHQDNSLFTQKPSIVTAIEGLFVLNGYIVIPIIVATSLDKVQAFLPVKDSNNTEIATVYLADNGDLDDFLNLSKKLSAIYLCDVSKEDYDNGKMLIQSDYVVIKEEHWNDYFGKYYETAPIWGGFYHQTQTNIAAPKTIPISEIIALENLDYPTDWHKSAAIRAIQQPYVFERFLKKYHLLELLFDYQFADEITSYDATNAQELVKLITAVQKYQKDEIKRLEAVLGKCTNWEDIRQYLNKIFHYNNKAKEIFYTFGKESNPLKVEGFDGISDFTNMLQSIEYTDDSNLQSIHKKLSATKVILTPQEISQKEQERIDLYNKFTLKLTAYWVYRVRSSIAHHKIGEYLMTNDDEDFMLNFAEPLLDELIKQCFKA